MSKEVLIYDADYSLVRIALPTCKDCKWWGRAKHTRIQRFCLNDNVATETRSDNTAAATSDDVLMTGPDFGCVHWEAKQ